MGDRAPGTEDAAFSVHNYHTGLLLPSLADACCVQHFGCFHGASLLLHALQGFLDCFVELVGFKTFGKGLRHSLAWRV